MGIYVSDTGGGGDFTPVPEGTHFAVCDMVVDLGKQKTTYMGDTTIKPQVYIRWQIPAERTEWTDGDGVKHEGPMVIGKTYTASLGEKANLRKDLQAWRGKTFTEEELRKFDISKLLGAPATISVTHKPKESGGVYANVSSIGGLPKGMDKPALEGDPLIYGEEDQGCYDKLPKWIREKIDAQVKDIQSGPYDERNPPPPHEYAGADLDDDVPF
jgi:hypothetical protein